MMEPKSETEPAILMEFKVRDAGTEASLEETTEAALKQIEERQYEAVLWSKGIPEGQILKYGFAHNG